MSSAALPQAKQIITVPEARKLLGVEAKTLSDDQILNLIITLTDLSSLLLGQNVVPKNPQVRL